MSSTLTFESSTTHPICNLFIPKATGKIFASLFHTKPSIKIYAFIFSNNAFKSVSISYTFTSKVIIDFAAGFSFFGFAGWGFGFGAYLAGSSSPNNSSSSALFSSFFSSFFSYFLSSFLFSFFGLALKALWASLGSYFGPMVASVATRAKYQATMLG